MLYSISMPIDDLLLELSSIGAIGDGPKPVPVDKGKEDIATETPSVPRGNLAKVYKVIDLIVDEIDNQMDVLVHVKENVHILKESLRDVASSDEPRERESDLGSAEPLKDNTNYTNWAEPSPTGNIAISIPPPVPLPDDV